MEEEKELKFNLKEKKEQLFENILNGKIFHIEGLFEEIQKIDEEFIRRLNRNLKNKISARIDFKTEEDYNRCMDTISEVIKEESGFEDVTNQDKSEPNQSPPTNRCVKTMKNKFEIEHTTNGIINKCSKCKKEIKSVLHKCNIFQEVQKDYEE